MAVQVIVSPGRAVAAVKDWVPPRATVGVVGEIVSAGPPIAPAQRVSTEAGELVLSAWPETKPIEPAAVIGLAAVGVRPLMDAVDEKVEQRVRGPR